MLPQLAPRLGVAIPQPELVSADAIAYRCLAGEPCDGIDGPWPEQLGRVLRQLHGIAPEDVGLASTTADDLRARLRGDVVRQWAHVGPLLATEDRARANALITGLLDDDRNWRFPVSVVHRDLGPEHVLVDPTGALAGVIDWEEVGAGDPAGDFAWWLHVRPAVGGRMLAAYGGPTDDRFRARAACLYALTPWHEVEHGIATGDASFIESGLAGARDRLQRPSV